MMIFLRTLLTARVRKSLYVLWASIGLILTVKGLVTQDDWSLYTGLANAIGQVVMATMAALFVPAAGSGYSGKHSSE